MRTRHWYLENVIISETVPSNHFFLVDIQEWVMSGAWDSRWLPQSNVTILGGQKIGRTCATLISEAIWLHAVKQLHPENVLTQACYWKYDYNSTIKWWKSQHVWVNSLHSMHWSIESGDAESFFLFNIPIFVLRL